MVTSHLVIVGKQLTRRKEYKENVAGASHPEMKTGQIEPVSSRKMKEVILTLKTQVPAKDSRQSTTAQVQRQ